MPPDIKLLSRTPNDGQRITKRTVKDQVSDKLAYMIHSGLLQPGDELPSERELAATLGVSRVTVRGAIGVLQARRMIEIHQGARTRVLGTGPFPLHEAVSTLGHLRDRSFAEVSEARETVEIQVIRIAAKRITPAALGRLAGLIHDQETMLEDPVRFQISDREFHSVLYEACGNKLLADVVLDFYDYGLEYRRPALKRPGAITRSLADHQEILAAIKLGDPEKAAAAAEKHLRQVHKTSRDEIAGDPRHKIRE